MNSSKKQQAIRNWYGYLFISIDIHNWPCILPGRRQINATSCQYRGNISTSLHNRTVKYPCASTELRLLILERSHQPEIFNITMQVNTSTMQSVEKNILSASIAIGIVEVYANGHHNLGGGGGNLSVIANYTWTTQQSLLLHVYISK